AYSVAGNPIFVAEAKPDAGSAFIAVGAHRAIGFHAFGIEDVADDDDLFRAFEVMQNMSAVITEAQAAGRIHGFRLVTGEHQKVELGDVILTIAGPIDTRGLFGEGTGEAPTETTGYGLIIHTAADEFLVVARATTIRFSHPTSTVEVDTLTEGEYRSGRWVPGRTLNGDERYSTFPKTRLGTVRIELLRR
ncbi:MAG: DUF5597 domain-containing protein, partial [Mycetocola sp.]